MKQNIECVRCAGKWERLLGAGVEVVVDLEKSRTELHKYYPDTGREIVAVQTGTALRRFRCDGCNEAIESGAVCCAVGVFAPDMGTPELVGWESEYIRKETKP